MPLPKVCFIYRSDYNDPLTLTFTLAIGPGMYGCLSCGSHAANAMAAMMDKPIVGVHHMVRILLVTSHKLSTDQ